MRALRTCATFLDFLLACVTACAATACVNEQEALKLYGADVKDTDTQASLEDVNDTTDEDAQDTANINRVTDTDLADLIDVADGTKSPDGTVADVGESSDGCGNKCAEPPPPISGLVDPAWAFDANSGIGWLFGGETWYALSNTLFVYSAQPNAISWTSKQDAAVRLRERARR